MSFIYTANGEKIFIEKFSDTDPDLKESDLKESDLKESDLKESDKKESDKKESDKKESDLKESDKKESDLKETDLKETDLKESDLKESDLKESDLKESDLKESDLKETNKKESNEKKEKETKEILDKNIYSHVRLYYKLDKENKYVTLFPKYLLDEDNTFYLAVNKENITGSLLKKTLGKFNEPSNLGKIENSDDLQRFKIVNGKIVDAENSKKYLVYMYEKKEDKIENKTLNFLIELNDKISYKFFIYSKSKVDLNIFDNGNLNGILYKINKDRNTFYVTRNLTEPLKYMVIGNSDTEDIEKASIFKFKPLKEKNNKKIIIDLTEEQEEYFKKIGFNYDQDKFEKIMKSVAEKKDNLDENLKKIKQKIEKTKKEDNDFFISKILIIYLEISSEKFAYHLVDKDGNKLKFIQSNLNNQTFLALEDKNKESIKIWLNL